MKDQKPTKILQKPKYVKKGIISTLITTFYLKTRQHHNIDKD